MIPFPEAPAGTDHWQPAAPSAPAKQHDLRPPLFPMERGPVCSGHTPALSSRGHGQVSSQGWSCSPCLCERMCDVFGAIMISLCFVLV